MAQLPIYQRANVQVAQPGGSKGATGLMAEAQAKSSLAQRLSSFSEQILGVSKGMAQTQAAKDAVIDVHNRKQQIADINKEYSGRDITEDEHNERINRIAAITEGAEKKFYGVYSKAYNNAATAAYSNQVTMDAKTASDLAMLESEGNSDWYQTQMKAFREETVRTAPTKETSIIAELAINQYGSQGYKALKTAEIREEEARRKQSSFDTVRLQSSDIVANMQEGDWASATTNLFKLRESNNNAVKNGWKDAEQAQLEIDRATENGILAYAKDRFSRGETVEGQDFIDSFREGGKDSDIPTEFFDVDREKVASRMEYLLDTEIKRRDATDKAFIKERKENSDLMVRDAITILKNGKIPDNIEEIRSAMQYASPTKQHDLMIQIKALDYSRPYNTLSLPDQMAAISQKEAEPTASIEDVEVLATIKENLKEKLALAKRDMITLGAQDGLYNPTQSITPGIDLNMGAAILIERTSQAMVSKEKYGVPAQVFTEIEATQWSDWINSRDTSISDKMDFIKTVESATNGKGHIAYRQLLKDKRSSVFTAAGDFYAEGKENISKMLLHGEMVLNSEMGASIDRKELTGVLNSALGNTLSYSTKQDRDKVVSTAMAYYASLAEGYGALGDKSYEYADDAVEQVLGKQGVRNGQGYFAPLGMEPDDVDDFIDDLDPMKLDNMAGIPAEATKDVISRSKLIQVQANKYRLVFQGHQVTKEDGSPYFIEVIK